MAKTFQWKIVQGIHVSAFGVNPPSNEEWNAMINGFIANQSQITGVLVYTAGGAPNALQRKRSRDISNMPKTALLTDSALARAAMTALNLFIKSFKAFAPNDLNGAFEYLAVPPDSQDAIKQTLSALQQELTQE
jgi:hypothetical protein